LASKVCQTTENTKSQIRMLQTTLLTLVVCLPSFVASLAKTNNTHQSTIQDGWMDRYMVG